MKFPDYKTKKDYKTFLKREMLNNQWHDMQLKKHKLFNPQGIVREIDCRPQNK